MLYSLSCCGAQGELPMSRLVALQPWGGTGQSQPPCSLPRGCLVCQSMAKSNALVILVGAFFASPSPRPAFSSLWNTLNVEVEILCGNPEILSGIAGTQL